MAEQGSPCGRTEGEEGHMQTAVQCWERARLAGVLKPKAHGQVHVSGEQVHLRGPEGPPLGGVSRWPLSEG